MLEQKRSKHPEEKVIPKKLYVFFMNEIIHSVLIIEIQTEKVSITNLNMGVVGFRRFRQLC